MIDDENLEEKIEMLTLFSIVNDEFTDLNELKKKKWRARLPSVKDDINQAISIVSYSLEQKCRLLTVLTNEDISCWDDYQVCLRMFNAQISSMKAPRQIYESSSARDSSVFRVFSFQKCNDRLWKLRNELIADLEKYGWRNPKYDAVIFCLNVDHLRQLLIEAFANRESEERRNHLYSLVEKKLEMFRASTFKESAKVVMLGLKSLNAIKQPEMHKFQSPGKAPKLFGTYWNCENSLREISLNIKRANYEWIVGD